MFLIRILHLRSLKKKDDTLKKELSSHIETKNVEYKIKDNDYVDQIKSVTQEKKINPVRKANIDEIKKDSITSFDQLLEICNEKKEIKLKYELEKNVNLVGFSKNRIEISFNDNLDKNFVKDLSSKLFEWTNKRWIITFSKNSGQISIKDQERNKKKKDFSNLEESQFFKDLVKKFSDIRLVDIKKDEEV
jgi:DNA polymerase-3 subunit gamma/tau